MKIWTCGSSPRSGSRNAWTRIKTSTVPVVWATSGIFWRNPNDFLSRMVTMDETLLYHYDPETKQQSMEWRLSGSPRPKKFRVQNSAGKVLASIFLGSRRHPPHWLPSKEWNYQRRVLLIFAGATELHFEGKSPRERHPGGLVLARQCPGSPGTCNPEETGPSGLPMTWSPTLFSESGPVGLPPVPWTEKNNWNVAIFCQTRRALLVLEVALSSHKNCNKIKAKSVINQFCPDLPGCKGDPPRSGAPWATFFTAKWSTILE